MTPIWSPRGPVDRHRGAAPALYGALEVLGGGDARRPARRERDPGSVRTGVRLVPLGALDEMHALGLAAQRCLAFDPEQPALRVADRDQQLVVERVGDQQLADDRHRDRERVVVAVGAQRVVGQLDRGHRTFDDAERRGALPGSRDLIADRAGHAPRRQEGFAGVRHAFEPWRLPREPCGLRWPDVM